jgi:hypothetical protein
MESNRPISVRRPTLLRGTSIVLAILLASAITNAADDPRSPHSPPSPNSPHSPGALAFPAGDDFGAGLTLDAATPLSVVVAHPERYEGKPVLVRGRITDVCQSKGCWTVITDDAVAIRIRFKDYGFFLPKDAAGRDALAEGFVKAETLDEKTARHYEAEAKDGDPGSIKGPQRVVGFTASGVRLLVRD